MAASPFKDSSSPSRPSLLGTASATEVSLRSRELVGLASGKVVWSQPFAPELGNLRGPLRQGPVTYLGAGPVVLAFDDRGRVLTRYDLSAPVLTLDGSGGLIRATVSGDGYRETFTLIPPASGGGTQERVVFEPDPAVTLWTALAADSVPDAEVPARWARDTLNPFLGLRAAAQARTAGQRGQESDDLRRVMASPQPFPVWVKLAARLDAAGYPEQADLALELARADAAQRGYDPAVRVGQAALTAYGQPMKHISALLEQGRLNRAEVWMRHVRTLHPRSAGGEQLYLRYAKLLESQGRAGEATEWRRFAASLRSETLYHRGPQGLAQLRDICGLLSAALAVTLVLSLWATVRRVRRSERAIAGAAAEAPAAPGGHASNDASDVPTTPTTPDPPAQLPGRQPWALLRSSTGERLVFAGLSAALVLSLSGGIWAKRTALLLDSPALNIGTYGGAWAEAGLARLPLLNGPDAALLRGLGTQLSGDLSGARVRYQAALSLPCARNNLGVISAVRGDRPGAEASFRAALAGQPDLGAAAYNLGFPVLTLGSTFQERHRPSEPRLCYPDDRSLIRALGGDVTGIWRAQLSQPAGEQVRLAAEQARQGKLNPWLQLWLAEGLTLGALLLLTLRRLPAAPHAPDPSRRAAQRPDPLAWVLPGSGLLRWVWGGPLMLGFVTATLAWVSGRALGLMHAGAAALPWPLSLWPQGGWPATLPGLSGPWPLAVMGLAWLVNALCLWALGRHHRGTQR